MQLTFDKNGYLHPFEPIQVEWGTLESIFANNEHRRWLLSKVNSLLDKLNRLQVRKNVVLFWVNGSFDTKKELPKDIDIVAFVQHENFQSHLQNLRNLQAEFQGMIDFYFEPFYPEGHKLHNVFLILKNDWQSLFTQTRRHPQTRLIHRKGFLQINPDSIF
jgi:uncharacterized protein DUF6932